MTVRGATKFITVRVDGGKDGAECQKVAYAIAHSPLVKTAFCKATRIWGAFWRQWGMPAFPILSKSGLNCFWTTFTWLRGGRNPQYREEDGQRSCGKARSPCESIWAGDYSETVWTCDLSHDYVSINADYRS